MEHELQKSERSDATRRMVALLAPCLNLKDAKSPQYVSRTVFGNQALLTALTVEVVNARYQWHVACAVERNSLVSQLSEWAQEDFDVAVATLHRLLNGAGNPDQMNVVSADTYSVQLFRALTTNEIQIVQKAIVDNKLKVEAQVPALGKMTIDKRILRSEFDSADAVGV